MPYRQLLKLLEPGVLIEIEVTCDAHIWAVAIESEKNDYFVVHYNTDVTTICRKRLSTIALSNNCRINHLHDLNYTPFQESEIVNRALSKLGACKKNTNSENFAKECRNGAAGWMSYSQLLPHIKPGCLIEIKLKTGLYDWAVAIKKERNDYFVVHAKDRKVKYKRLIDITGHKECRINNLNDLENAPFPEIIIVERAMRNVGKVNPFEDNEYFARECRYGVAGWIPYDKLLPHIKLGDLIEIDVSRGMLPIPIYHWAVAIEVDAEDCFVVNLRDDSVVYRERLSKISLGKNCRINNAYDEQSPAFKAEDVVKRALDRVGKSMIQYSLRKYNCEHFAKYCRNGDATSHQVRNAGLFVVDRILGD
uniref:LRAT domain-containing protein n=1 Tax=Panagrellus redivivus TaxID=6233 RepID=A0A7E4UQ07_PANRE